VLCSTDSAARLIGVAIIMDSLALAVFTVLELVLAMTFEYYRSAHPTHPPATSLVTMLLISTAKTMTTITVARALLSLMVCLLVWE